MYVCLSRQPTGSTCVYMYLCVCRYVVRESMVCILAALSRSMKSCHSPTLYFPLLHFGPKNTQQLMLNTYICVCYCIAMYVLYTCVTRIGIYPRISAAGFVVMPFAETSFLANEGATIEIGCVSMVTAKCLISILQVYRCVSIAWLISPFATLWVCLGRAQVGRAQVGRAQVGR